MSVTSQHLSRPHSPAARAGSRHLAAGPGPNAFDSDSATDGRPRDSVEESTRCQ